MQGRYNMKSITRNAYAKINLGLDVTGVLPNGYHEVKMVMQTVNLYDELTIKNTTSSDVVFLLVCKKSYFLASLLALMSAAAVKRTSVEELIPVSIES